MQSVVLGLQNKLGSNSGHILTPEFLRALEKVTESV